MRVAVIHDWLTGMRGGEAVLEAILELVPGAELFTLLYVPNSVSPQISSVKRHTSFIQNLPRAEKRYRYYLPLFPRAIESFDVNGFDLVISSSHCVAKGVRKPEGVPHLSYVHAPMRYFWTRFDDYFGKGRASPPVRLAANLLRKRIQRWDRESSSEVDRFVANSQFIRDQIKTIYGRDSRVIYPFVDLSRFSGAVRRPGSYYLMVSALVPYKRVDLAVEAFNRLKLPLLIVGSGPELGRLSRIAGPSIQFLGNLSTRSIVDLYAKCRAFVFPGIEDFGITPLEAMAAGAPVIAYGAGGLKETVTESTGCFFQEQSADALIGAVQKVENGFYSWSSEACRSRAKEFSRERFQREFCAELRSLVGDVPGIAPRADHSPQEASPLPLAWADSRPTRETSAPASPRY